VTESGVEWNKEVFLLYRIQSVTLKETVEMTY